MPDPTYDAIDGLVDEDPIALRDLAWQLLRERDEARARANEAARLSAEARDQADDLRRLIADLREEIAIIDESRTDMTVIQMRLEGERDRSRRTAEQMEGERDEARVEVAATKHFRGRLHKQVNAMRPVVEAAVAFRGIWGTTTSDDTTVGPTYRALIAAVEKYQHPLVMVEVSTQDAPSRPRCEPQSDENGSGVAQDVQSGISWPLAIENMEAHLAAMRQVLCTCPWNNGYHPGNPLGHHISCPALMGQHTPEDNCARSGIPMAGHRDA